ncbi:hypothetical protein [Curtobacterium pusillum]|uniref:hypothetical protein n=1 Tax=Curtobacterium pusillum TaxID=69373 RepID=UPI0011A5F6F1|nr:hypothetical protein [Curtobacterium pusillum]
MTRSRTTLERYPARGYHLHLDHYETRGVPRPVRRAQVFPWWIWALGPLLTIGVVFAMLQAT